MTHKENITRLLPYASYLDALMVNMFFENWQGQKIIDCNEKVHESAYVRYNIRNILFSVQILNRTVSIINIDNINTRIN